MNSILTILQIAVLLAVMLGNGREQRRQ